MSTRRRLTQLHGLQRLQRAESERAALDHAVARAEAEAARAQAKRTAGQALALAERWYAGRAVGHFTPEIDALAAGELVATERRAQEEHAGADRADTVREDRADAWRLADARQQAMVRIVRDTRRAIDRAGQEALLDRLTMGTLANGRPA